MAAKVGVGCEVLPSQYVAKPYFAPLMYRILCVTACFLFFFACSNNADIPDVSAISVNLTEKRFENSFFSGDTIISFQKADRLDAAYGSFFNDFLYGILNVPQQPDSALQFATAFLREYKPLWQDASRKFANTTPYRKELEKALQFVRYYFPDYTPPQSLITFIGPATGYSNILTQAGVAVGLQLYMGSDYPLYQQSYFREIYPMYLHRRFTPLYIVPDAVKNIVNELVPPQENDFTLLGGMVDAGKRIYVLKKLLPYTADSILSGYTMQQLKDCKAQEAFIWDFFLRNNLLFETDPLIIKPYISDGPNTAELGPASPGNIGLFTGWQIVNKWMEDHPEASLKVLIAKPAKELYSEVKYKP